MARLDLSHLKKCDQRWDEMTPVAERTRLCESCERHIVDFRGLSTREVVRRQAGGPVCGVYTERQLRKGGAIPQKPRRWRAGALALGLVGALPLAASGQTPTIQLDRDWEGAPPEAPDTAVVRGTVTLDGEAIPGVNVIVRPEERRDTVLAGAATDFHGDYSLDLRGVAQASGERYAVLEFSFIGTERQERRIDLWRAEQQQDASLVEDMSLYDIAFYVQAPDEGSHPYGPVEWFGTFKRWFGF